MKTLKKKSLLLLLMVILVVYSIGCSKAPEVENDEVVEEEVVIEITDPDKDEEQIVAKEGIPSPLSGLYYPEELIDRRPIVIVFDNHSKARPQAGLIEAEIAYEFLAEGDITRYVGVFLAGEPKDIGGIRSARPYLIQKALEFDGYFVHVGYSPQGDLDIRNYKVNNINALNRGNDVFWRKNHKYAPHNMYSSYEAIRRAVDSSKYRSECQLVGYSFHEELTDIEGKDASEIKIFYSSPYQASYIYNKDERIYYRYYNGKPHLDEITEEQLTASNIIIQVVKAKVVDSELRLEMETIGSGTGLYITKGKTMEITWKKDNYQALTKYYDEEGKELILNPGKTWIQVIKNIDYVTIIE
ncbi:DUF3048 domain-containing protein [Alkaliphilus serpentinus]|uniref:DUF3048 domain-containing protein n=1 Tax=Alkaliphilus serpentinus TaxID=1482731 RepID=A0A833HRP1_9FIRM|nr:DUF3048 domain-containing protein [Alkaliphilus serpentinus]KAB3533251.1 DUF3048 domain-containing protein [Alkaliphilus serpentinus]